MLTSAAFLASDLFPQIPLVVGLSVSECDDCDVFADATEIVKGDVVEVNDVADVEVGPVSSGATEFLFRVGSNDDVLVTLAEVDDAVGEDDVEADDDDDEPELRWRRRTRNCWRRSRTSADAAPEHLFAAKLPRTFASLPRRRNSTSTLSFFGESFASFAASSFRCSSRF